MSKKDTLSIITINRLEAFRRNSEDIEKVTSYIGTNQNRLHEKGSVANIKRPKRDGTLPYVANYTFHGFHGR